MPFYEVSHVAPLTKAQKDDLAAAITELQSNKFGTPKVFIAVVFRNNSGNDTYVAGKVRPSNMIHVSFRDGPMHTEDQFDSLCTELQSIWDNVLQLSPTIKPPVGLSLHGIHVQGGTLSALEYGIVVPRAGKEKEWAMANMAAFKQRAQKGDEDVASLLAELASRAGKPTP
ncbi:hypothetical protein BX600DRAFT_464933 [Xylariales sp. PMI_506]|nr:hypothetical protein BX600DRAFT_464933 [Xylariales sp. PMI_506]